MRTEIPKHIRDAFSLHGACAEPGGPGWRYSSRCWGGAVGPSENPDLNVLDWMPPPWLADLYAVHDGFGRWAPTVGFLPGSILPWSDVTPLTRHVRFGEENIRYDPADCIRVAVDPLGGGLAVCGRKEGVLRWFDGQDHHLGPALTLNEALGRVALLSDIESPER